MIQWRTSVVLLLYFSYYQNEAVFETIEPIFKQSHPQNNCPLSNFQYTFSMEQKSINNNSQY